MNLNEQRDEERRQILSALERIEPMVIRLDKAIYGNGEPGLKQTVALNTSDIADMKPKVDNLNRMAYRVVGGCAVIAVVVPVLIKVLFK